MNTQADDAAQQVRHLPGADILWEILVAEGVEVVFGYPGGAIMPAYDALPRHPIEHVLTRHEQGASHMADGYARASGRPGVCIATSGPGATNLVTGLATAMMDSIPVVAITGQVPSYAMGTDAFQETDVLGVMMPVTKHGILVTRPEDIAPALREAFAIATSGRKGPVIVDITKDAQIASCDFVDPGRPTLERPRILRPHVTDDLLDEAARLIDAAERPVILAGHGLIQAGACDHLQDFIAKTDVPAALTLLGLGALPADHPRALGMMGMHGEAWVNRAIQEADLLIALGMRFDDRVTGNPATYAPHAKKIHVEFDPSELGKVVKTDVGLCGDLVEVLTRLTPRVADRSLDTWNTQVEAGKADDLKRCIVHSARTTGMQAPDVIDALYRHTGGKAVMVSDVGQHQMWEAQYYKHGSPRQLLTSGGLGTMGFALPAAMGARYARDADTEVWVVCGDGGFQMTACELSTCAEHGLNVNIAIVNNGFLGMVRQWQEFFFDRRYVSTPMHSPDFVKLAEAHGLNARRVERAEDIADAIAFAQADPGTTVIDFRVVEEDNVFPMVATGRDLHDMIRRPDADEEG